jgi:hypothetical protein
LESIQQHINELEWVIDASRDHAKRLRRWGWLMRWPIPLLLIAVGAFAAFIVMVHASTTDRLMNSGAQRLENRLTDSHPFFWGLLYMIGPPAPPIGPDGSRMGFAVWLAGFGLSVVGFIYLGNNALNKAKKLEARAEKYDDILTANRPTWLALDALLTSQSQAGSGNVVTIIQQINKMVHQPEPDKSWYVLPAGTILIGVTVTVLAAAITKWLGLT